MNNKNIPMSIQALVTFFLFLSATTYPWQESLKKKIADNDLPAWAQQQIQTDLAPFAQGITRKMLTRTHTYSRDIGHFAIINGTVYSHATSYVIHLGKGFSPGGSGHKDATNSKRVAIHKALQDLASCISLPNVEFLVGLTDGVTDTIRCPGPLYCFSKNQQKNSNVILIPDPDILQNHAQLQQQALQGNSLYNWDKKIKKAFWRGGANDVHLTSAKTFRESPRFKLVTFAKKNPLIVDALFTTGSALCRKVRTELIVHKLAGTHIPIEEHMRYAYQVVVDGFTAAWSRMYWQLFCNSIILKQQSDNIQWYYGALKPYEHFIPLNNDISNIEEQIRWADHHPQEVQQIINNANNFAQENLTYADILYYMYTLLTEYAPLQKFEPSLANFHLLS